MDSGLFGQNRVTSVKEKLERGESGDDFSYELEKDAIRWEDLIAEKKHWLDHLRAIERLLQ